MKKLKGLLSIGTAAAMLLSCTLTASALTEQRTEINVTRQTGHVTKNSTVYVGEVEVSGGESIKYLYSDDITNSSTVLAALLFGLKALDDGDFAKLVPGIAEEDDEKGIAKCSDAAKEADMNASWKNAKAVRQKYYSGYAYNDHSNEDLFKTNAAFAEKCTKLIEGIDVVDNDNKAFAVEGPLGVLSSVSNDSVTYTVIDGQLVKIVDREIDYNCESIKVVYTKSFVAKSTSSVKTSENILRKTKVYAGEVVLDGETQFRYLYSPDFTVTDSTVSSLTEALSSMKDKGFASLLDGMLGGEETTGLALCSAKDHAADMDKSWASAEAPAAKYFPEATLTKSESTALYDTDEGYKAKLDAWTAEAKETIDQPAEADGQIVSHLDSRTSTDVYYTIEDGVVTRHSDITVIFDCEAAEVIYTRAELSSAPQTLCAHDPEKVNAKAPTETAEGNIEYYVCKKCGKLFADKELTKEIALADTVVPKLAPSEDKPETKPEGSNPDTGAAAGFGLTLLAAGALIAAKKRK